MTLVRIPLDGAAGTDLTLANSGAVLLAGQGAGLNTARYSSPDGATFTMVASGSATGSIGRWAFAAANITGAISMVFRTPETLTVATNLVEFRTASAGKQKVKWDTGGPGGRLVLLGTAGENNYLLGGGQSVGLAVNTQYRLELQYVNNTSAAGGTATFNSQLYDMSDTLLYSYAAKPSGDGSAFTQVTLGNYTPNGPCSVGIHDAQLNDGATAPIGKYVAVVNPPTARAVETDAQAIVNATTSSPANNGTLTYSISPTAGVVALAPGIWQVAPQAAAVVYTVTATETFGSGGSTATATTTVTVAAAGAATTGGNVATKVRIGGAWT